ncbi:MAG: CvpA family protein [Phycisphaerales bacterium]|nr:CvpA family protein [Phycisphaerales bacterium]
MWFCILLLLVLAAVTYFQAIQGLTSAIITGVLTVLSAAIAFGTYEYVAQAFLQGFLGDLAYAVAFLGMFLVPLGILRLILDSLVPRSSQIPHMLDRIGAGVVGFFTAFLATGMLAIGLQMVPWPGIIGYERFNHSKPSDQNEVWLHLDRAVAAYGVALSDGVFGGGERFNAEHPDLVSELGWLQAANVGVRRTAPEDALAFQAASEIPSVYEVSGGSGHLKPLTYDAVEPGPGKKFLRVTIKVSGDKDKLDDPDDRQRFTPSSVRLLGTTNDEPQIYPGMAVPDDKQPNYFVRNWDEGGDADEKRYTIGQTLSVPASGVIEVVFEVPTNFQPTKVKYKFGAEAPVRGLSKAQPEPAAPPPPTPTPTPVAGGRISGVKIVFGGSHFGADLPVVMTDYQGTSDVQNGVMHEGSVSGRAEDQGAVHKNPDISSFAVPEGKALLHLDVESLKAGSLYGKAMNFAAQTVENYIIEDNHSHQLTPVGKYAVANVGGENIIEIQYYPMVGGRVKPFERIKSTNLQKDYQLVYLYLLDSGAQAMKFSPGGNLHPTDLSGENLVAP